VFETLGVRTGFPFGHYYFTDLMGPKLGVVPIMLGVAYIEMAYLSWTLACLIVGRKRIPLHRLEIFILPIVASCIMVSWDVSQDPVWSTVLHAWVWEQGGMYFGVPLSNFFGWFLTVLVIYERYAFTYSGGESTSRACLRPIGDRPCCFTAPLPPETSC
jgi:putative membrane protein